MPTHIVFEIEPGSKSSKRPDETVKWVRARTLHGSSPLIIKLESNTWDGGDHSVFDRLIEKGFRVTIEEL